MDTENQQEEKTWYQKKENWWITVGFIIAIGAISAPLVLIGHYNQNLKLDNFEKLGVVGDFFGGTTVGLFSLASIIFVTAAIIMQKEELALQRKEVTKTREEYEITNATMKKQQFDSTFFNMINLHHAITKDIMIEEIKGRAVMKEILKKLDHVYQTDIYDYYSEELKLEAMNGDKELLDELIRNEFLNHRLNGFILENQPEVDYYINEDDDEDTVDSSAYDDFHYSLLNGTNEEWNVCKEEFLEEYKINIYMKNDKYKLWLDDLDFKNLSESCSTTYTDKFKYEFIDEPLKKLKIEAFEKVYNEYESQLGHYFRNLYRIAKLIHDEKFHVNEEINSKEKKKYRGILRAQLSSYELVVIFYNLVYSSKGEKFKQLLNKTYFFDDHLSNKDFIWKNDEFEIYQMDQ